MVGRSLHEERAHFDHRKTNLDFSDPIGHCDRLILALLLSSLATRGSFEGRSCRQTERSDCHCASCNLSARATHLASLGRRVAHLLGCNGAGVRVMASWAFLEQA